MPVAAKQSRTRIRRHSGTREQIIQHAIALFNRYGVQNVAIGRIASSVKISRGNLTYHFRLKNDLVRATLDALRERLMVALQRPVAVESPTDGAAYLIRMFRTFWDFRYFFNSLTYLLAHDRKLRKEYWQFKQWLINTMEADIGYLAERGHFLPPIDPDGFRLLSENIWGQLLHWLRMQQIESPAVLTPSDGAIYDAALHLWSLCHLWMNPEFADELLGALGQQLGARAPETSRSSS